MSCKHGVDTTVKECATCRAADPDEKPLDVEGRECRKCDACGACVVCLDHGMHDEVARLRAVLRYQLEVREKNEADLSRQAARIAELEEKLSGTAEDCQALREKVERVQASRDAARRELEEARRQGKHDEDYVASLRRRAEDAEGSRNHQLLVRADLERKLDSAMQLNRHLVSENAGLREGNEQLRTQVATYRESERIAVAERNAAYRSEKAAQARVGVLREALVTARNCIAFDGSLGPEEDSAIANKALRAIDIALEKAREAEKAEKR